MNTAQKARDTYSGIRVVTDDGTHEAWNGSKCLASTRDFQHSTLSDVWEAATEAFRTADGPALLTRMKLYDTPYGIRCIDHTVALRKDDGPACRRF